MHNAGIPNVMGDSMSAGMQRDKMSKTMPMMYGGMTKKPKS